MVRGLLVKDFITFEKCVSCAQGKHHRKPHLPKQVNSISQVLQLLHMDFFGPVNVLSINRSSYCLVVIDDFSRFTWVFFLSHKAGISELIKKFIVLVENQTNNRVRALLNDNRTEFKNSVLDYLCAEKGILRQFSSAHTPQQNGVAERRNRTLKDAARTMLCDSKLPVFFWAEAINTDCYVQNRVLINKAQMKTPSDSHWKSISEDEDEEFVYKPVSKSFASSKGKAKASLEGETSGSHKGGSPATSEGKPSAAPEGESSATSSGESSATRQRRPFLEHDSPQSVHTDSSDAEATPHISTEKEFIPNDASTVSSTFMELLFPDLIADEYVAEPSSAAQPANEGVSVVGIVMGNEITK
ncbi:uncharacterized protein LOC128132935 [Lactuca sativa]|uniref:uncharacterized protein LOC128132935 n=1 Tax=Lactuca sativa TaxID=4236 RepID=UPI0022AF9D5A|nr:uncharacterized protein LOC128132935 [Lactuca sativa]